jgi:hypothetical protein
MAFMPAKNPKQAHFNERITRGAFASHYRFNLADLVIATDADEILSQGAVAKSLDRLNARYLATKAETFTLRQFMLADNLIAPSFRFVGPSIIGAARYQFLPGPQHWRYAGKISPMFGGAHFSWVLPMHELIRKLDSFAHAQEYQHVGNTSQQLLDRCIAERCYLLRDPPIKLEELQDPSIHWPKGYAVAKALWSKSALRLERNTVERHK